jgi:hypothetical protein
MRAFPRSSSVLGQLFARSPSAQPVEQARAALSDRRRKLIAAANAHQTLPEPVKPADFRVRLVKSDDSKTTKGDDDD